MNPYIAVAAIAIMALALWYGWTRATRVPSQPELDTEALAAYQDGTVTEDFDAGYEAGEMDGYWDGVDGARSDPYGEVGGMEDCEYRDGYLCGYAEGYADGVEERERLDAIP